MPGKIPVCILELSLYYTSDREGVVFAPVCTYCASTDIVPNIEAAFPEAAANHKKLFPMCRRCQTQGRAPQKWGKGTKASGAAKSQRPDPPAADAASGAKKPRLAPVVLDDDEE